MARIHVELEERELELLIAGLLHTPMPTAELANTESETWKLTRKLMYLLGASSPAPVSAPPPSSPSSPKMAPVPSEGGKVESFVATSEIPLKVDSVVKNGDSRLVVRGKHLKTSAIVTASCWEPALFPKVLGTVKQTATFLVKEVVRGDNVYLNIVGVK